MPQYYYWLGLVKFLDRSARLCCNADSGVHNNRDLRIYYAKMKLRLRVVSGIARYFNLRDEGAAYSETKRIESIVRLFGGIAGMEFACKLGTID